MLAMLEGTVPDELKDVPILNIVVTDESSGY
jgi:hypothetical protein